MTFFKKSDFLKFWLFWGRWVGAYLLIIMFIAAGSSGSSMISETVASNALPASDDDIISRNSSKKRGKRGSLSKSQSVTKERKQQDLVILCDKKPQQYITSKVSRYNQGTNRISGSVSKMSSNFFIVVLTNCYMGHATNMVYSTIDWSTYPLFIVGTTKNLKIFSSLD